jgi:hypothetical protein
MDKCTVCCDTYNKTNHKKVTCPFCNYESCKTCNQTYLLSIIEDPHCMKCKNEFSREFVDSFCTKRFRNVEYKKHREQVLYEREMARMPETQPHAEYKIKMEKLRQEYYLLLDSFYMLRSMRDEAEVMSHPTETYNISMTKLRSDIQNIVQEVNTLEVNLTETGIERFTRKCPSEICRGFLDKEWICGLCTKSFCNKCSEEIGIRHVCDEKLVKTMKLINKDTKPCPKCGTMIYKIDGCAQMWCTDCHTAFDWRSGRIETGRVHNPHYFEFKKRSREHGDIPCGGRPTYDELVENDANEYILDLSYKLSFIDRELIYRYGDIYDDDNLHLRVNYLTNEISDEDFKKELQKRDKYKSKTEEIRNIYEMFSDTCGDLLRQWILDKNSTWDILYTVHELAIYSNQVISRIQNRYNSSVPHYIFLKALKSTDIEV